MRQWTDRTKTFTVDAQFIGLHDGKIHLHKMNGVKIAVPIAKMSTEDLEYVEKITGVSLEDDKPLADLRRQNSKTGKAGATIEPPKPPEYDWFDFFLKAGVGPYQCERYSQNFNKDSMDESILPDITPETLRTLGLKEGDILRVMRYLDNVYNRPGSSKNRPRNVSFGGEEVIKNGEDGSSGGLFSGPGGVLHNNTRKGRPAPAVQTSDTVDSKVFEQLDAGGKRSPAAEKPAKGFDDDAWEVKHPKRTVSATSSSPPSATTPGPTAPPQKPLSSALADLSLLHPPLQPSATGPAPQPASTPAPLQPMPTAVQSPQHTGATPGFFSQLAQQPMQTGVQGFSPQATGFQPQSLGSRPAPQIPQATGQTSFLPTTTPPQRPFSAPQNFPQPSGFGVPPIQPQLTGIPHAAPSSVAPPGQSLTELTQQRFQSLQPQPTGFAGSPVQQNGFMAQPTGFGQQQPSLNGQSQTTGFQPLAAQPTGFSVPQLQQPMQTGFGPTFSSLQPQATGMNGIGSVSSFTTSSPPPVPPIPQQPTATPLVPQKTGPPPPVRFGVKHDSPKKLTPQATGLRANLAQASKCISCKLEVVICDRSYANQYIFISF